MRKIKQQLKKIYEAVIGGIITFKDPCNPFPGQNDEFKTDTGRR